MAARDGFIHDMLKRGRELSEERRLFRLIRFFRTVRRKCACPFASPFNFQDMDNDPTGIIPKQLG